jgi:hypothetical protein
VSPMAISWIAFGCVFGGALAGMLIRRIVPEHHLGTDSKDVIKLAMGLLATMSALVLALLISSAKTSHDTQSTEVTQMAADFIQLDRVLAHYGPQTSDARALLYATVAQGLSQTQSGNSYHSRQLDAPVTTASANSFFEKIQQLEPRSDFQRSLYAQAMQIGAELGRLRSLLLEQTGGSIPMPFLVVLIFWLAMLFASFGLFAPSNATVVGVLLICAISVAGAIFLVLEMDRPFEGLIQISGAPLHNALAHLGK